MKLLVITDSYPPHHSGGYELRAREILDGLDHRNHEILVLTSKCPRQSCDLHRGEKNIFRKLHADKPTKRLMGRIYSEYLDIKFIHDAIHTFRPDLIYLFHVINLTRTIYPYLADRNIPIVFDEGGKGYLYSSLHRGPWYSFIDHKSGSKIKNRVKPIFVRVISLLSKDLLKQHWIWPANIQVYFNSHLNRQNARNAGLAVEECPVIHSGIDEKLFEYQPREKMGKPIQILVPGRIESRKSQMDAIALLAELLRANIDARLIIVGTNNSNSYLQEIMKKIDSLGLEGKVEVLPMVEHQTLVRFYQESDICFFTSRAQTGLSRVPLEAMACGCLLFTYGDEGSNEIVEDKETGFIVPRGNVAQMVETIRDLCNDHEKYRRMIRNARKSVEENHTMDMYIDTIEYFLKKAVVGQHGTISS